ncbi:efflux RND transporter periplasmic adaptor subunit [Litoribacter ruber]|uniref:efflux RND transporter periplasmic adaptor subunit n=1 Tax=Litoribacter ruber TaxID=702568 RepID=UPI001BD98165|nr:efflux RND transporter periplasmic adaptor subunit [Litoribacter ruber]MBT0810849.1 efflux RND transporter periplasmic adaptor subunit [Litoribacter ruber]
MKTYSKYLIVALGLLAFGCAENGGDSEVDQKKQELENYRKEAGDLKVKIDELEREIAALDPSFARSERKSVLITTTQPQVGSFQHFVEVTGSVMSKKNVNISAEVSGRIQEIPAIEGMRVRKGQVIARIDDESAKRNVAEIETQLELARTVYERQKRLWDQEIGTEMQYLEAKNRKESLEKNLESIRLQEDRATIVAPFDGTVEQVMVRMGELVQPGSPIVNFIGESDLFIEGDVSERYVGILSRGDSVEVNFPSLRKNFKTKVTAVGSVINPNNRTFKVEVFLPRMDSVKPNMLSTLKIMDYESATAITVPTHLILQDNKGEYIYVVENSVARKQYIERGMTYSERTEILEGLTGEETLVDKGFREVGDNFKVNISA